MPRSYGYQYETSPRKIKPEYTKQTRKVQSKTAKKPQYKKNTSPKNNNSKNEKLKNDKSKMSQTNTAKIKFSIFIKCVLLCLIVFIMIFRNSQISQSFSEIQKLKTSITSIEKENSQLEISIQNSLNLNNIEQAAKELLGMQKRTNKQTIYINLPKKDYVEPRTEEIIIEENKSWFDTITEKIKNIF